jgi:hypothetical protein
MYIYLPNYLSIYLYVYLIIYLPDYPLVCLSVYLTTSFLVPSDSKVTIPGPQRLHPSWPVKARISYRTQSPKRSLRWASTMEGVCRIVAHRDRGRIIQPTFRRAAVSLLTRGTDSGPMQGHVLSKISRGELSSWDMLFHVTGRYRDMY